MLQEIRKQVLTFIVSALGLTTALIWYNTILKILEPLTDGDTLVMFMFAIGFTIASAIVVVILSKRLSIIKKKRKKR